MKSIEWIERLIAEKKLPSDRQAALMLGMTAASMSAHRQGKAVTLDDKYAYRLEELLALPHGKIVLDQHMEREKNPEMRDMWKKLAGSVAFALLFCQLSFAPNPANAQEIKPNEFNSLRYIYISYLFAF